MRPLILIPARMQAVRLPGKPMLEVGDAPMIVQVWRRAVVSGVGKVAVACDAPAIAAAIESAGGKAVLTDPAHPSGSDRIWEALLRLDPGGTHDVIINLQGDMPTIDPAVIGAVLTPLADPAVDIATLAAAICEEAEVHDPAVVKVVLSGNKNTAASGAISIANALYFTRCPAPYGDGPRYHHIGIYAYRRAALERFVSLPPSPLELREKLEQLRALEAGMRMDVALVDTVPLGVDTPETLEKARSMIHEQSF